MNWIVDVDYYDGETAPLVEAIEKLGDPWQRITRKDYFLDTLPTVKGDSFAFCTLQVAKRLRQKGVGSIFDFDKFKTSYYRQFITPSNLLNQDSVYFTWKQLPLILPVLLNQHNGPVFIKPDDGCKTFPATVLDSDYCDWIKEDYDYCSQFVRPKDLVFAAKAIPPSELYKEFRCFVVGGKCVTSSQYKNGSLSRLVRGCPEPVEKLANEVADSLKDIDPTGFVVDIVVRPYHGIKVVEINSLNCSGLYAADAYKLVSAIKHSLEKQTLVA